MILIDSLKSMPCHIMNSNNICHHYGHQIKSSPFATPLSSLKAWQVVQQCFSDSASTKLNPWRNYMMSLQDMPVCNGQPCAGSCFPAPATQIRFPGSSDSIYLAARSLHSRNIQQLRSSKLCSTILGKSKAKAGAWMDRSASDAMRAFELTFHMASLAVRSISPHSSEVYILGCGKLHPITFQYLEALVQSRGPMYFDGLQVRVAGH